MKTFKTQEGKKLVRKIDDLLLENLTDPYDELRRLSMPAVIFPGGKDIILRSDETADRIGEVLPHIDVTVFPDKGHSLSGLAIEMLNFAKDVA